MMWSILYNLGILLLKAGIWLAAFRSVKARKRHLAQKGLFAHWESVLSRRKPGQKTLWVHCASLGEFDGMIPVLEKFRQKDEVSWFIAVSFFSPSGYEKRKDHPLADATGYLPLDLPAYARRMVRLIQPDTTVFVKYEFWKNHFQAIKKQGSPLIITGVRFAKNAAYFGWFRGMYKPVFRQVDLFLVQNPETEEILRREGYTNVHTVGDSRIDRAFQVVATHREYPELAQAVGNKTVLIVGSTWQEDERVWIPAWKQLQDKPYLIVAPHEPTPQRIAELQASIGYPLDRWSERQKGLHSPHGVLIDTIGDLAYLYRYGSVAYIGGAFGRGLHNIIEPIAFRIPVVFGPKINRFPEATDAAYAGFGLSIQDETTAGHALAYFLKTPSLREKIDRYLSQNRSASDRICEYITQLAHPKKHT
jgi:3-deoxy-D-manno-octulosonic-acid transferase